MAKTEQVVTDKKTMKEIVNFVEAAVREGLTEEEILSQIDLILDKDARGRIARSEKDVRAGRVKRFKSSEELLANLHSK